MNIYVEMAMAASIFVASTLYLVGCMSATPYLMGLRAMAQPPREDVKDMNWGHTVVILLATCFGFLGTIFSATWLERLIFKY